MRTLENGIDVAYVYTNVCLVFLYGNYRHTHNGNELTCFSASLWAPIRKHHCSIKSIPTLIVLSLQCKSYQETTSTQMPLYLKKKGIYHCAVEEHVI